jgi:putative flippase GtrA
MRASRSGAPPGVEQGTRSIAAASGSNAEHKAIASSAPARSPDGEDTATSACSVRCARVVISWSGFTAAYISARPLVLRCMLAERIAALRRSPLAGRATRYTIGSVIAAAVSVVVFAVLLLVGVGTTVCSILAFVAGAIPNWILNRRWAWQRQGRPVFAREVFAYIVISLLTLVAASAATAWTKGEVPSLTASHGLRVALVTASYLAVFALLFVFRFALYEVWIFSGRSRVRAALRSRRQVLTAARANRTP